MSSMVMFEPRRGHFCNHNRRWVKASEDAYPLPEDLAKRHVRHNLGKIVGEAATEAPAPAPALDDLSVSELRVEAEGRGIDLPSGYVKRDDLLDLLQDGVGTS